MPRKLFITILFVLVSAFLAFKFVNDPKRRYDNQAVAAAQVRLAMEAMMEDLREARAKTLKGVPADGKWHHEVIFNKGQQGGALRY
jgi:hypothetical protein